MMIDEVYKSKHRLLSVSGDLLDADKCRLSNHTHELYNLHRKWPYVNSSEGMDMYVIKILSSSYKLIHVCVYVLGNVSAVSKLIICDRSCLSACSKCLVLFCCLDAMSQSLLLHQSVYCLFYPYMFHLVSANRGFPI